MNKLVLTGVAMIVLSGCASDDYRLYTTSQATIETSRANAHSLEMTARYNADAARYKAMAAIAESGDAIAKVAAVVAMAMDRSTSGTAPTQAPAAVISAPQTNNALAWASILVPGVTQLAGIAANMRVATVQSDNSTAVALSTNNTFSGMARNTVDLGTTGFSTASTISSQGTTALSNVASQGFSGMTSMAANSNAAFTTVSGQGINGITTVSGQGTNALTNVATHGITSMSAIAQANDAALSTMFTTNSSALSSLANKTNKICVTSTTGLLTCQ